MKSKLLMTCLIFFLSPSFSTLVFLPFSDNSSVKHPIFSPDVLEDMRKKNIFPLLTEEGDPLYYLKDGKKVLEINWEGRKFGSRLSKSSFLYDYGYVIGGKEIENLVYEINYGRWLYPNFDSYLVKEGKVKYPYESFADYFLYKIREESPSFYKTLMKAESDRKKASLLDEFVFSHYELNPAYDLLNIYENLANRRLGYFQYFSLLSSLLKEKDVSKLLELSKILNDPAVRKYIEKSLREGEKLWKNKQFKDALMEILSKYEYWKLLLEFLSKLDKRLLAEMIRDYLRYLIESGQIKEIEKLIKDPNIQREFYSRIYGMVGKHILSTLAKKILSPSFFPLLLMLVVLFSLICLSKI